MKVKPWLITIAVCLAITGSLAGVKFVQVSKAMAFMESFPPPFETVTVASTEADDWQPSRRLSGTVQSPEHLVISAETPGRIVQLPYQSGETVPVDAQVLVLFDDDVEAQQRCAASGPESRRNSVIAQPDIGSRFAGITRPARHP